MSTSDTKGNCRVWVVSEVFYPEETGTGHILTRIAEGLAREFPVHVICGRPSYASKGMHATWRETHNRMEIERCWGTTWDKDVIFKRLTNLLTISCSIFLRLLIRLRRNERVLVVTNPPLLPFLASIACRLRRAKCILLVHDVYPEVAIAAGLLRQDHWFANFMQRRVRRLYRSAAAIVVIGRDMKTLAVRKSGRDERDVTVIPNPADVDTICPLPRVESAVLCELGLADKFVIQYAGNMGPVHDIEGIVACAEAVRDRENIHFLMIGSGAKRAWLERTVRERGLTNVSVLPPFARKASCEYLNACDVALGTFVPGMLGAAVPSRTYNVLAAGKPMIVVAEPSSEVALVVEEERVGWVVPPCDVPALVNAVVEAATHPDEISAMGLRARHTAESKYHPDRIAQAFVKIVGDVTVHPT
jgi:colanic acid biosynthesis glycosyl transferase WcaI